MCSSYAGGDCEGGPESTADLARGGLIRGAVREGPSSPRHGPRGGQDEDSPRRGRGGPPGGRGGAAEGPRRGPEQGGGHDPDGRRDRRGRRGRAPGTRHEPTPEGGGLAGGLDRALTPDVTPAARGRGSPGLGVGDAAWAEGSDGAGRADGEGWPTTARRGPGRSCRSVHTAFEGRFTGTFRGALRAPTTAIRGALYRDPRGALPTNEVRFGVASRTPIGLAASLLRRTECERKN